MTENTDTFDRERWVRRQSALAEFGRQALMVDDLDAGEAQVLDQAALCEELFRAYLHQILVVGVFHADPHPGNVFLTDDHKIALLDLGMVGRIGRRALADRMPVLRRLAGVILVSALHVLSAARTASDAPVASQPAPADRCR